MTKHTMITRFPIYLRAAACALLAIFFSAMPAKPQTVTRLSDVRKIYVEKMDQNLDEALRTAIAKAFPIAISAVSERKGADAVLVQTKIDPHDVHTITVNLTDTGGKAVLWSGSTSDRDILFGGLRKSSTEKIARHLIKQLKKAMHR